MPQRLLQQCEGADNIGLDEFGWTIDRAVDVALGRKVHHVVWLVLIEQLPQRRPVADVDAGEAIAAVALGLRDRVEASGIGELVDIDDERFSIIEQMPDNRRADKAGAASNENDGIFKPHASKLRAAI